MYFLLLEKYFLKIPKNSVYLGIFFAEAYTEKHRHASAKPSAFADCQGEFQPLLH